MKISELPNAPDWLKSAQTDNADVDWQCGYIVWNSGDFLGGDFRGGNWLGGSWYGSNERLLFSASQIGIVPDDEGMCVAYRTTTHDCHGRHNREFIQCEGEFYEDKIDNFDDATTCVKGIHVTTAAKAHTYFGVNMTAQMWRVRFHICDLIACDGEKARISGGIFEKIERPF